jgi:diguanylate cyclase (GGDEF)-like protein
MWLGPRTSAGDGAVDRRQPGAGETLTDSELAAGAWRRAHAGSGVTSGLILAYVERAVGRDGVKAMLSQAGLLEREAELRNENCWFSFDEKIALWSAAERVCRDPEIAERVGEDVLEFRVGTALKRTLRALGSPDLVYRNVVRANSKFNWAHSLEAVDRGPNRVRLSYHDISGVGFHHFDCDYTTGLLRAVPQLFGLPPARVTHNVCGARGGDRCEFDVWWTDRPRTFNRVAGAVGLAGAAAIAIGAAVDRALLLGGAAVGTLVLGALAVRAVIQMRRRIVALEAQVRDGDLAADAQLRSLAALSSELRLERALEHVTASASTAIVGARFALLIRGPAGMRADHSSTVPELSLPPLEHWADEHESELRQGPMVIDSLAAVPSLKALALDDELPLGSACAAPLTFHDELLGVLIALAPGATVFLPNDARSLEIYAGHAAMALWNARLVSRLEREAAEDPLTGLANRRAFSGACEKEMQRAAREGGDAALVVLDLDHFKDVNDAYGHPYGDRVLIEVAAALKATVRGLDTVARIGGEEFALLLPGADTARAWEVAERARANIAHAALPHGAITCSAGIAAAGGPAALACDLLALADGALYEAKRKGRNRTVIAGEGGDDLPAPSPGGEQAASNRA